MPQGGLVSPPCLKLQVNSLYGIEFSQNRTGIILGFIESLKTNFIVDDKWRYLLNGLKVTLIITFLLFL